MPIQPAAPAFPRAESLVRFFRTHPSARVPLSEVAELLGTTVKTVRAMLRAEGQRIMGGSIPWTEAAAYLLDAWPRVRILDALSPAAAALVPPDFRLARVAWSIPIFIVRAMEYQAAAWRSDPRVRGRGVVNYSHARGVDDYVADVLYNEIEPSTLEVFSGDRSFLRAFHYPDTRI